MIVASNRVPGQMLPVGARYWYNAGQPLNTLRGLGNPDGLGYVGLSPGAMVVKAIIMGSLGYYVGSKIPKRAEAKRFSGVVGAVTSMTLGVPGLALTTFLYAPRSK